MLDGDLCILGTPQVFNPVAPYRYLLSTVYLFRADIANPDLFVCSCCTWICLEITRLYEEQRQPSSGSAWSACQNIVNRAPIEFPAQFAHLLAKRAVIAPPLVGCVVWSIIRRINIAIVKIYYHTHNSL